MHILLSCFALAMQGSAISSYPSQTSICLPGGVKMACDCFNVCFLDYQQEDAYFQELISHLWCYLGDLLVLACARSSPGAGCRWHNHRAPLHIVCTGAGPLQLGTGTGPGCLVALTSAPRQPDVCCSSSFLVRTLRGLCSYSPKTAGPLFKQRFRPR